MPIRRIDILVPAGDDVPARELCGEEGREGDPSEITLDDGRRLVSLVISAGDSEAVLDRLAERFEGASGFRATLMEVVARLPTDDETGDEDDGATKGSQDDGLESDDEERISRNELIELLKPGTQVGPLYVSTVVLSAVIASIGLLRDSAAVVIGAMMIAPLLLPNMSLALAATLGDLRMALRSLLANATGGLAAASFAALVGLLVDVDPSLTQIAARTEVGLADVAIATAAGAAGALAVTTGASANIIGVMVAVALLPPTVAFGLLLGAGRLGLAAHAAALAGINLASINLAAVAIFLIRGIRPGRNDDAGLARTASLAALVMWLILVAAITGLVLAFGRGPG